MLPHTILIIALSIYSTLCPAAPAPVDWRDAGKSGNATDDGCSWCNSRLWHDTGPDMLDVRQEHFNDCWWKAVQVAVTHHAKYRIMNFFRDSVTQESYANKTGDALNATNPMVQLFNPDTYVPEFYYADIKWRDLYDDKNGTFGVFWPDAMTQAMRQHSAKHGLRGYNYTTTSLDEGGPDLGPQLDTTLSVLTGKPAWINEFSEYNSSDALYALLERAIDTPMLFSTVSDRPVTLTDPAMKGGHVYPIISAFFNQTTQTQMVLTRNVWGRTDNFTMADVWKNGKQFIHLENFDHLV